MWHDAQTRGEYTETQEILVTSGASVCAYACVYARGVDSLTLRQTPIRDVTVQVVH